MILRCFLFASMFALLSGMTSLHAEDSWGITVTVAQDNEKERAYSIPQFQGDVVVLPFDAPGAFLICTAKIVPAKEGNPAFMEVSLIDPNIKDTGMGNIYFTLLPFQAGKRLAFYKTPEYSLWIKVDKAADEPVKEK
jgi:hypothetical protein